MEARFNASIGTSNLQAISLMVLISSRLCFNASIGTSNLQAARPVVIDGVISMFQCLNRHEQPSSLLPRKSSLI